MVVPEVVVDSVVACLVMLVPGVTVLDVHDAVPVSVGVSSVAWFVLGWCVVLLVELVSACGAVFSSVYVGLMLAGAAVQPVSVCSAGSVLLRALLWFARWLWVACVVIG